MYRMPLKSALCGGIPPISGLTCVMAGKPLIRLASPDASLLLSGMMFLVPWSANARAKLYNGSLTLIVIAPFYSESGNHLTKLAPLTLHDAPLGTGKEIEQAPWPYLLRPAVCMTCRPLTYAVIDVLS